LKGQIDTIFHLAGWSPSRSSTTEAAVRAVEVRIGAQLPSSVHQFVLCENSVDFLRAHSNCDEPIEWSKLGTPRYGWEDYDPLRDKLLPFMIENQGVCTWAITLGDAEDPPVFVEVDSGSPPKWELTARTFTEWLTCQVEDTLLINSAVFAAQAPGLNSAGLTFLRSNFIEGCKTFAWPGAINYRFSNARSRLLLWNGEKQCDWWISPVDGVDVDDVIAELCDLEGVLDALYALQHRHDEALKRWKHSRSASGRTPSSFA
jgi:hypothetical protein